MASYGSQAPPSSTATAPSTAATNVQPGEETIHTTANHPWLSADRGWVVAGKLQLGEQVLRADGSVAEVVALTTVHGSAPMWDLTVSNVHDFTVGNGAYVVHNCGGNNDTVIGRRMQRRVDDSLLDKPTSRGNAPIERATGKPIEIHHLG